MSQGFKYLYLFVIVFAFFGFCGVGFSQRNPPKRDVSFTTDQSIKKAIFKITGEDTVYYDVRIAYDGNKSPKFYYSQLTTPVCETGVCYIVAIVIYWDLAGTYFTYDLPGNRILTKLDHKHFDKKDYAKLDGILADTNWPLGEYPVEELVVPETRKLVDSKVDGYTGATAPFVREKDNIKGALYTIYTLWQFVYNDAIVKDIKSYSQTLITEGKIDVPTLLTSERESYWELAVKQLSVQPKNNKLQDALLNILAKCDSYLAFEVLKCIDGSSPAIQLKLWEIFKSASIEKKQEIEEYLRKYRIDEKMVTSMTAYMPTVKNPLERMLVKKMIDRS